MSLNGKRGSLALVACLAVAASSGCVERKLLIRADPPGAEVTVDGVAAGTARDEEPIVVPFEHYGIRKVAARARDHVPQERTVIVDPPWWQVFPIDFVADVLIPWTITDEREVPIKLERRPRPTRAEAEAAERRARAFVEESERRP